MSIVAKKTGGGDYTPVPAGTWVARCVQVIDKGTQFSAFYQNSKHKVMVGWEIPGHQVEEDDGTLKPGLIWKTYTLSLHENATLRQDLEAWRGKRFSDDELEGFDLENIVDKPCLISVVHRPGDDGNKVYANVHSVMALTKGTDVPARVHPTIVFDLSCPDLEVWDTFSPKLKEQIANSPEGKEACLKVNGNGAPQAAVPAGEPISEDDIPF